MDEKFKRAENETPEAQLYGDLAMTRDRALQEGLDNANLLRYGVHAFDRVLKIDGGGDNIYGHLVTLRVEDTSSANRHDFFSINTYSDGRLQVVGVRRPENEPRAGYLVTLDKDGNVIEGFPTDHQDMFKKKIGLESEDLSEDEAREFAKGVKSVFDSEYDRRAALIPKGANV